MYSSAPVNPSPASSTGSRHRSHVSTTTSCPRRASARASAIAGNACPASPNAATSTRSGRSSAGAIRVSRRLAARRSRGGALSLRRATQAPQPCPAPPAPRSRRLPRRRGSRCSAASTTTRSSPAATPTSGSAGSARCSPPTATAAAPNLASFARAWDRFTGADRPRLATPRELRALRSYIELSLLRDEQPESLGAARHAHQARAPRPQQPAPRPPQAWVRG